MKANHFLTLRDNGDLYGYGHNEHHQLTADDCDVIRTETLIAANVKQFAAGNDFTAVLFRDGRLRLIGDTNFCDMFQGFNEAADSVCVKGETLYIHKDGCCFISGKNDGSVMTEPRLIPLERNVADLIYYYWKDSEPYVQLHMDCIAPESLVITEDRFITIEDLFSEHPRFRHVIAFLLNNSAAYQGFYRKYRDNLDICAIKTDAVMNNQQFYVFQKKPDRIEEILYLLYFRISDNYIYTPVKLISGEKI
jgi:hypothetical protein